jgi:hypothetical protein
MSERPRAVLRHSEFHVMRKYTNIFVHLWPASRLPHTLIRHAGKSITLAVLAAWGRHTGRIVVYLPSASVLTAGGLYHKWGPYYGPLTFKTPHYYGPWRINVDLL